MVGMKKTSKRKLKSLSWYKIRAWKVFSKWIRARDKNICFTCGGLGNQAGHFIPRSISNYLYFSEDNVHAQCLRCNVFLSGNSDEYAERLGNDIVMRLRIDKRKVKQWTVQELIKLKEKYENNASIFTSHGSFIQTES